jgi:hypothetical protein
MMEQIKKINVSLLTGENSKYKELKTKEIVSTVHIIK